MAQDDMASASGTGPAPSGLSRDASQAKPLVPDAGRWAVFLSSGPYPFKFHEIGVIDSVEPKTVWAKVGYGRRLRRFDHDNIILAESEGHARRIHAQLETAKSEAYRRIKNAQGFYRQRLGELAAQGMSTGTAKTALPGEGEACQPDPEGDAPKSVTEDQPREGEHGSK